MWKVMVIMKTIVEELATTRELVNSNVTYQHDQYSATYLQNL